MTVVFLNISSILFKYTFVTRALSESSPVLNLLFLLRVYALNNESLRESVSSFSPHKLLQPFAFGNDVGCQCNVDVDVDGIKKGHFSFFSSSPLYSACLQ